MQATKFDWARTDSEENSLLSLVRCTAVGMLSLNIWEPSFPTCHIPVDISSVDYCVGYPKLKVMMSTAVIFPSV